MVIASNRDSPRERKIAAGRFTVSLMANFRIGIAGVWRREPEIFLKAVKRGQLD